jgi:hypothetical protein
LEVEGAPSLHGAKIVRNAELRVASYPEYSGRSAEYFGGQGWILDYLNRLFGEFKNELYLCSRKIAEWSSW